MVKLTPDLIEGSAQYINPVRDRELDLRGYKIPVIENLGATLDQFDCIDFSDNEIRQLDNFPFLPRLKTLFFNNNRIIRIGDNINESLPNLNSLILTNNSLQELADLERLAKIKSLTNLSLMSNPVISKPDYRLYLIHKLPNLRMLDFRKVKLKEREEAKAKFKSEEGKKVLKEIKKRAAKTFTPGAPLADESKKENQPHGLNPDQIRNIKAAIARATTLEEIERLNQMLRTGQIPGTYSNGSATHGKDEEMDEE
ncbi:U2 small nuclear ribonucleoprotein A' [Lepeophtheirus salmonis]|uniref:Probable U2 small nuclear ribonucleoprotein A' n=1 Tax=Lepeophtheirus salmonis TaxID=72036 RepID=A0A0K2V8V0_LEPSM|nr:U2 small nuclear ribonucleoprotein A'-like [Lepeophtheirus salmonis]